MIGNQPRTVLAIGLMIVCAALGGCKKSQLAEERNALFNQNTELQDKLNSCNAALDAAQSENERLAMDLNRARTELSQRGFAAAPPPLPTANPNAFSGLGIDTDVTQGRITLKIPGDVLFATGKTDLKQSARETLTKIAGIIKKEYPTKTVRVLGYTDTDPIRKSKWKDNLQLSLERAASVHRYLQERGVRPSKMEAVGMGEWHPRSSKAKSRRVEIVVVTE